ncbi:Alkaline ceramidase 3 [Podila minutissima]|uniref:Alkaline ceramidase 3 n=1 Tax=Podila minutissima TaxID=64525 RepID=A0A9P5SC73_9FUNG|nr:Alkaline ceramidase 3 [Podila minutissima]
MLYSATIILFILVEAKHGPQDRWFPLFLTAWIAITTFIFSTTVGQVQFYTFQSTYSVLELLMIYYLRTLHVQQRRLPPNSAVSVLMRRALALAVLAVTIWLVDLRLCEFVNAVGPRSVLQWNPQLHAWWHVFSECALYHATMLIAYYHYDVRGQMPTVGKWMGVVLVMRLSGKGKAIQ